jgi:ATP-dependent RNA helicase DDX19/DBP5
MADLASRITKPDEAAGETPIATEGADGLAAAQADGAGAGGSGLQDVSYDVEVSLNELQKNLATPFGSVKSFEELGLYVAAIEPAFTGRFADRIRSH